MNFRCNAFGLMVPCSVFAAGFFLFFFSATNLTAQSQDSTFSKKQKLTVTLEPESFLYAKRFKKELRNSADTSQLKNAKTYLGNFMNEKGFREFSFDSITVSEKTMAVKLHIGPRYFTRSLIVEGLSESESRKAGINVQDSKLRLFNETEIEDKIADVLENFADNGYPFARFDSLTYSFSPGGKDSVLADMRWRFEPGKLVKIDSIIFTNKKRESNRFVYSVIGIKPGDIYSLEEIQNIRRMLNGSTYFRDAKQPRILFDDNKAKIILEFDQRKAGRFDLLLGILPPLKNEGQKIRFTALVDIQLVSPVFRAGELIRLKYEKLIGSSQKLLVSYKQPYLFGTPFSMEGELNILKQDTLFFTRYFQFAAGYQFNPFLSMKAFYKNKTSSLLSTAAYKNDSVNKPPVLDARDNTYGLGFTFDNLDYRFNPTKGVSVRLSAGFGKKKILHNPKIHENIYTGLQLSLPRQEAELEFHWYRKTFKRQVVHLANRSFWMRQQQYFQNDFARLGGSQLLRGFNENQFYARFYSLFTGEYRYLLEQNSFLFAFCDFAYLENPLMATKINWPVGVGLGMVYETKAGMVSVTYAVGKTGDIPFQPSRGRIHVGLINQF